MYRLGERAPTLPEDGNFYVAPGAVVVGDVRIGKTAEQQIGFSDSPMPGPEQQPPLAFTQIRARSCGPGHVRSATPKARTGRARVI